LKIEVNVFFDKEKGIVEGTTKVIVDSENN